MHSGPLFWLVCRGAARFCAFPLAHVVETMRLLPITALPSAPDFVLGLAIVRGMPVPVVDVGRLLGASGGAATRMILLRAGERRVALAVESLAGVRRLTEELLGDVPPLLQEAEAGAISAIGTRDRELLLVLEAVRILPDSVYSALESEGRAA